MAYFKLGEGIRTFVGDLNKLKDVLKKRLE